MAQAAPPALPAPLVPQAQAARWVTLQVAAQWAPARHATPARAQAPQAAPAPAWVPAPARQAAQARAPAASKHEVGTTLIQGGMHASRLVPFRSSHLLLPLPTASYCFFPPPFSPRVFHSYVFSLRRLRLQGAIPRYAFVMVVIPARGGSRDRAGNACAANRRQIPTILRKLPAPGGRER